jgi:flagellin
MPFSSGARINTNISALNALNALNNVNRQMGVSQLRLASGKRINSSADDPSGYAISKKMEGRIRSLNSALDNVGDAQSVYGVAEGAYQTIADMTVQIKEKITRFNNGAMGTDELNAITQEIVDLAVKIQRHAASCWQLFEDVPDI